MMDRISAAHCSAPAPDTSVMPWSFFTWILTWYWSCILMMFCPPRPMMRPSWPAVWSVMGAGPSTVSATGARRRALGRGVEADALALRGVLECVGEYVIALAVALDAASPPMAAAACDGPRAGLHRLKVDRGGRGVCPAGAGSARVG